MCPHPCMLMMAPVVEDMLQEAQDGLTEAVVIGPGRAILFYGRCSRGEGLKADQARDAAFLLTSAGMWVGKLAYLTANPVMSQDGKRAITQAASDCGVKARGPDIHELIHWSNNLSGLIPLGLLLPRDVSAPTVLMMDGPLEGLPEAKSIIGDEETSDCSHPGFHPHPETMVLKVIEVHYPWCLQYHPSQITRMDLDILDDAGGIKKKPA